MTEGPAQLEKTPSGRTRLPPWFRRPLGGGATFAKLSSLVEGLGLHTVCQSARCPNQGECWTAGTATFMILGDVCTRGCRYCAVPKGRPQPLDMDEPRRVGSAVLSMNLRHAVITSVDRDDVPDGGASVWAATIREIRRQAPGCAVEVLIPDFRRSAPGSLDVVLAERPDIVNHNIETVPRLFPMARKGGDYRFSLDVLRRAAEADPSRPAKSGIMLGLGERDDEVRDVLRDLRAAGVQIVSMGQYLAPEKNAFYLPVHRFVTPDEFAAWAAWGRELGFRHVEAGPLVRSSYHAEKQAGGSRPRGEDAAE
ncbi:MAG: Lipoyl synthase [Planctomycetes bacterium]|nr:Lipoyl synthase [Planctomycetota bacterium]